MTPEERKQQLIREAYGLLYESNKDYINGVGLVTPYIGELMQKKGLDMVEISRRFSGVMMTPSSIENLCNNNGWTIADQYNTSDLTGNKRYDVYYAETGEIEMNIENILVCLYVNNYGATHFKEHVEQLKPLY